MYQTHKTYFTPEIMMADLVAENPWLLFLLEHFEVDFALGDKTVEQICAYNKIDLTVFLVFGNLYNGFFPDNNDIAELKDVLSIIRFLKNSHKFFKNEKYPELKTLLVECHEKHDSKDIILIEKFFDEYFEEVLEHLNYEESMVFPYICQLLKGEVDSAEGNFSTLEYQEHHTDIETKPDDLKNLLLKHVSLNNDFSLRRKFLLSLIELEYELGIHSYIEDKILMPVVRKIEKERFDG